MRHVLGFLVGIVLTAVAAATLLYGFGEIVAVGDELQVSTTGNVLVVVAGVLFGLVAALRRLSPLVPLAGGLLLLAAGIVTWVRPETYLDVDLVVDQLQSRLPIAATLGLGLLLGSLLVVVGLLPGGRRRPERERGDDGRDDDGFSSLPAAAPQAWRPSTQPYPAAEPYQRPPLDRPSSS